MRPAVFIDRDGTLIEERHYLAALDDVVLFPWSVEALRLLRDAGFALVVVTNQAGIARGYFDESFVQRTHVHLARMLAVHGVRLDGYYYCPHHPDGQVEPYRCVCDCRKPAPGLVRAAARDLGLALTDAYVVGDTWLDVELAASVGAAGVLVRSGHGAEAERHPQPGVVAAAVVETLLDAARWIAGHSHVHVRHGDAP